MPPPVQDETNEDTAGVAPGIVVDSTNLNFVRLNELRFHSAFSDGMRIESRNIRSQESESLNRALEGLDKRIETSDAPKTYLLDESVVNTVIGTESSFG